MKPTSGVDFMSEPHPFTSQPYGLTSQTRASWLDHFQVTTAGAIDYVWFGYADTFLPNTDPRRYAMCGTFYLDGNRGEKDPESAESAARMLVNLSLPKSAIDQPRQFMDQLFSFVDGQARQYETWPGIMLPVDQELVNFRRWDFAGGFALFASVADQKSLAIIGEGVVVESLSVETITDLSQYDVDADNGLRFSDLSQGSLHAVRSEYHPDFQRFLSARS